MAHTKDDEYITVTYPECRRPQTMIVNGMTRFCCGTKLPGSNKQPSK